MSKTSHLKTFLYFIAFILIVEGIGALSSLFAGDIKSIYNNMKLPPLAPPDYLFGIVWPLLYALIAISGFLIFRLLGTYKTEARLALTYFVLQLFINFIWSIIFFKGYYWSGVITILLLDLIVFICLIKFLKLDKVSGICLIPYLIWILFATYLSIGVALLN
ncbi:TspO/MBR family protein [Lactococcus taiwanensis]|uniref:TspO/MBR family protein n=1 Tax=Lactococcus taiwanensis TaxID=1151742 RepID=UPI00190494EF|nr:TspO/MBR family protein [Lactococcus taiwanensis]